MPSPDAERLARLFHETYERLAPEHGYETRRESAVPWEQVPANNRALMTAVCEHILASGLRADTGAEESLTVLADAIRDYHGRLRIDIERTQLVEVLDEHGIEIDFEEGPRA
ncbi:hypothetical protein [Pseudonocardia zijingensis]|uniref:Uncharacterized protein n=1 Tax=Pseudonocardia zijingensis TaxID=153376 RepID=A0ABN1NA39_9PSEU